MPNLQRSTPSDAPSNIGYVKECPICGHVGPHGPKSLRDRNDARFNRELPSDHTQLLFCQVPTRRYVRPGVIMAEPCGCDGVTGLAEALAAKRGNIEENAQQPTARPKCALPGCDELALADSSFCSKAHLRALREVMATFGKDPE